MGTRAIVAFKTEEGGWKGRYTHWDGYPSSEGVELLKIVQRDGYTIAVDTLIHKHYGWSNIDASRDANEDLGTGHEWTVSLLLNNDRDWQSHVHHLLRLINWDIALAGQVILVDAKNLKRVKARYAGMIVRDALDGLLTPKEIVSLSSDRFLEPTSLELTERQYQAIKDIGSLWRVDWYHLGVEFLAALEDS